MTLLLTPLVIKPEVVQEINILSKHKGKNIDTFVGGPNQKTFHIRITCSSLLLCSIYSSYFTGHHAAGKAKSFDIKSNSSRKTYTLTNKSDNTRLSNGKVNDSAGYYTGNIGEQEPDFGILFDIDGVIVRGKNVLPFAPQAFKRYDRKRVVSILIL